MALLVIDIMKHLHILVVLASCVAPTLCVQQAPIIGKVFSIVALALVVPHYIVFKKHLRMLDLLQLVYLFNYGASTFSRELAYSWVSFIPSFWGNVPSSMQSYLSMLGGPLSLAVCIAGGILIAWLITFILQRTKATTRTFDEVLVYFKGLIRWVYIGLVGPSVATIIFFCKGMIPSQIPQNLIAPIIVLAGCIVFPVWELIAKVVSENHNPVNNPKEKYLEFFSWIRLLLFSSVLYIFKLLQVPYLWIFIYAMEIMYCVSFLVSSEWDNPVEMVVFGITWGVTIVLFSFYLFNQLLVSYNDLDFYLVTIALGIELIYEFYKYVKKICLKQNTPVSDANRDAESIIPVYSNEQMYQPATIEMRDNTDNNLATKPSKKKPNADKNAPGLARNY